MPVLLHLLHGMFTLLWRMLGVTGEYVDPGRDHSLRYLADTLDGHCVDRKFDFLVKEVRRLHVAVAAWYSRNKVVQKGYLECRRLHTTSLWVPTSR